MWRMDVERRVVWAPLPGSQTLALGCPANDILYTGARGPGKTDAQLMRFRMRVGQGYGRYWRGVIFDVEYKNLDDLVSKSKRWFPQFNDGASFKSSAADYRWVWPTGEELLFRTAKTEKDYWNYHGQEFPFIGWNELTKQKTRILYDLIMSCNRSSFLPTEHPIIDKATGIAKYLPEIPLEVFSTCNPHGPGHNWVKKEFINGKKPGQIRKKTTVVFNPRTQQKEDIVRTQVHIFGSWRENRYLSPLYIATLSQITDKNKKKAWNNGDWDVTAGGMFDDLWDSQTHVVTAFDIPANWHLDRSFDYGSSSPFSVGWWAISDGSDVRLRNGEIISTVRGDVFRIAEWYGSNGNPNEGLRMLAPDIAKGIVELEMRMGLFGRIMPGPADGSIYDTINGMCIAAEMAQPVIINNLQYPGVQWKRADKSPGSRKLGWEKVRILLNNALNRDLVDGRVVVRKRDKPGLFVFQNCQKFVELFPVTPRDEKDLDDVDTGTEDHLQDDTRYKILDLHYIQGNTVRGLT